ncbi:MbnP family protein [Myroides sp. LJL119]
MKNFKKYFGLTAILLAMASCSSDDNQSVMPNDIVLEFENTFKQQPLVLSQSANSPGTINISEKGQSHHFKELKYVISNIRLVDDKGQEFAYYTNNLDKGAFVIDQSQEASLKNILQNIPVNTYIQIKFGLGVKHELNTLDELRFPEFYKKAGANDTQMMWEWGTGYRFTKIEGYYQEQNSELSIHTGSTLDKDQDEQLIQGVDAYRDVILNLPVKNLGQNQLSKIKIQADLDKLLSGKTHSIELKSGNGPQDNATPNVHSAVQMMKFVDNIAGDQSLDNPGMFSVIELK